MGLAHSPSIITDGLVLAVDAGNTKSYNVGISSTTWSNSVMIGIGTLFNMDGSNYESANGGSLLFNGTNQYVGFGSDFYSLDLSDKTFQCWIKKNGSSQKGIIDKEFDTGGLNYGGWGFWTQSNDKLWFWVQGAKDLLDTGDLTITLGTWTNVAVSYNYSSKTANFYINGILNSSVSDETIVENSSGEAPLIIGALRNNFSNFQFDGNISNVLAYNSLLSSEEISQNFNALRGRYGI